MLIRWFVVCCLSRVARCLLYDVWCDVVCGLPFAVGCLLLGCCCVLFVACCLECVVCCLLLDVRRLLFDVWCLLFIV